MPVVSGCPNGAHHASPGQRPGITTPIQLKPEGAAQRLDVSTLGARFSEVPNGDKRPFPSPGMPHL
ncbi:hypothetical protein THIOKS12000056 [Thiocapsa sp. KS1]|nr:hypothetical protein THIOKS12000056 [Thiocapsa sp. KS1]